MPTTSRGIRYPSSGDPADIPLDLSELASDADGLIGTTVATANGDIITYSTSEDKLPIGTAGQALTADSTTSTGLKWSTVSGTPANGRELISRITTTGGATSITFSSIPSTYTDLVVVLNALWGTTANTQTENLLFQCNSTNPSFVYVVVQGVTASTAVSSTGLPICANGAKATLRAGLYMFKILNYAGTSYHKPIDVMAGVGHTSARRFLFGGGVYASSTGVSSITIQHTTSVAYQNGSVASLYGIKRLGA